MNHFWLTDEQFSKIEPHLPRDTRGKARVDDPKFGGLGVFRGLRIIHLHLQGRRFSALWGSPVG